ncbi:nucleotide pyrophosphohydrolase [Streptomyces albireticuli]|uniref:Nucleotide pyrophosphohydrolase n=1 Tax=Streptomyces albireticuli TaxID=1940 RepID=A0A1Z2KZ15_9ACTN|nr:nucleotide pyrophosphohydrolase [Streptomyces albireticuli]
MGLPVGAARSREESRVTRGPVAEGAAEAAGAVGEVGAAGEAGAPGASGGSFGGSGERPGGPGELKALQLRLAEFAAARDWQPFHTPKNLAAALSVEAAELVEIFQWLTPEQSARVMEDPETAGRVEDEVADVLAYLLQFCHALGVDPAPRWRRRSTVTSGGSPGPTVRGDRPGRTAAGPRRIELSRSEPEGAGWAGTGVSGSRSGGSSLSGVIEFSTPHLVSTDF